MNWLISKSIYAMLFGLLCIILIGFLFLILLAILPLSFRSSTLSKPAPVKPGVTPDPFFFYRLMTNRG